MSQRTHFWLRTVGLAVILLAEFGPRLFTASVPTAQAATVTAVAGR